MQLGCRAYTIKLGFVHCPGPAHCDRGAAKVQLQLQDRDIAPDQPQWKARQSVVKSRAECESSEKLSSEQPWKAVHQWKAARKDCLCRCRPDNVWSGQCVKCVEHVLHCLHCVCFCACVLALYVLVQTCTVCRQTCSRNNMSGYDQGSHLASLAQTQLLLATPACAVASSANGQPSCVHKVCPRWEDGFSNVHYPILKF